MLTRVMRDLLGQLIIGTGTSAVFNNNNAFLWVGDGTSSADSSFHGNKLTGANGDKSSMDAGYPQYSVTSDAATPAMIFRSTFSTAQANFHWQEWGVKSGSGSGSGSSYITLNRVLADLGTKTNVQTWQLTATITPTT